MIELNEANYGSAAGFLKHATFDTVFAHSIIERRQKGRIFIDDEKHPSVALFWHYCGMAVLSGDCTNIAFNNGIRDLLLRRFESNQKRISIGIDSPAWKLEIEDLLHSQLFYYSELENSPSETTEKSKSYILGRTRLTHKFNRDRFKTVDANIKPPEKFSLRKIDREILPKIFGRVIPSFSWDSEQAFFDGGTGFCLMDGNKFAC